MRVSYQRQTTVQEPGMTAVSIRCRDQVLVGPGASAGRRDGVPVIPQATHKNEFWRD